MLNRNKIFKRVRDTSNTLNVSTNRRIDNVYTELMEYENMAQKRYDKIKNILETIRYHHNKIQNLNKNYQGAIFGGATDSSLLDKTETTITNIDILSKELSNSEFDALINSKLDVLINKFYIDDSNKKAQYEKDKSSLDIPLSSINESDIEFFTPLQKDLTNLNKQFQDSKKIIADIVKKIRNVETPLLEYIRSKNITRDFRQPVIDGLKKIDEAVDIDNKEDSKKLSTYSRNIETSLLHAKTIQEQNKDPNKNIDDKILKAFLKKPEDVRFEIDYRGTTGEVKIGTIKGLTFNVIEDEQKNTSKATAKIDSSELSLNFIIDFKENKYGKGYKTSNGKLTSDIFIIIFKESKYQRSFPKLCDALGKNLIDVEIKKELKKLETIVDLPVDLTIIIEELKIIFPPKSTIVGGEKIEFDKDQTIIKFKDVLNKLKQRILTEMEQTDNEKIQNKNNKDNKDNKANVGSGSSGKTFSFTNEESAITNSIISSIIENYEKERKLVATIEDKIKLDSKFVDNLDNLGLNLADIFKVNFNDKLAFIFFILVLHIVVYSLIESLIMNSYISDIVYIMATYVGIYCIIMFILLLILNKYVNYRMKTLLNYLNTDFNLQLISMHIFIVFMFYIIVLILSQHIDIFVAKDEDDKLQVLYRIEVISSVIFIFSSVFVMLL
tara:strand:+ start:8089 stop:10089 length:2001 start_codon:yes stop_codon:yes gene_type:complete